MDTINNHKANTKTKDIDLQLKKKWSIQRSRKNSGPRAWPPKHCRNKLAKSVEDTNKMTCNLAKDKKNRRKTEVQVGHPSKTFYKEGKNKYGGSRGVLKVPLWQDEGSETSIWIIPASKMLLFTLIEIIILNSQWIQTPKTCALMHTQAAYRFTKNITLCFLLILLTSR